MIGLILIALAFDAFWLLGAFAAWKETVHDTQSTIEFFALYTPPTIVLFVMTVLTPKFWRHDRRACHVGPKQT